MSALPTIGQIQRNRGLADMMTQRSFGGPVIAPMQGIGRLAQALSGRLLANRADRQETQRREAAQSRLADLLSGAPVGIGGGTMPMGGTATPAGGMPMSGAPSASGGGFTIARGGGPSVQDMLTTVQTFPELAGVLNPMIARSMQPAEPTESFSTLSSEETQRLGFAPGTVVQRNNLTGEISVEGKPIAPGRPIEVADPTSPTGTRFVSQAEALNMAGPPRAETTFQTVTGPDGETRVTFARGRPGSGKAEESVSSTTRGKLEQSITQATTALGRIGRISENLNDEFLRLPEQIRMRGAAFAERLGAELDPETKEGLKRFTRFKTSTLSNLNRTLNELSGAAISPAEAKRLEGELPTMSDSPSEFRAKVAEIEGSIQAAIRRNQQLLARGVTNLEFDRSGEIKGSDIPTLEEFMLMEERPSTTAAGMGSTSAGGPVPERPTAPSVLNFDAEGNLIE